MAIPSQKIDFKIDGKTGLIKSLNSYNGVESRLEQEFLWYPSSNGSDGKDRRPSGAYIFRPAKLDDVPIDTKTDKGPAI